ncbi:MAG: hypothetical protein ACK5LJ_00180, partial [Paracoccus sp. (in: a-proteobacteria)]
GEPHYLNAFMFIRIKIEIQYRFLNLIIDIIDYFLVLIPLRRIAVELPTRLQSHGASCPRALWQDVGRMMR